VLNSPYDESILWNIKTKVTGVGNSHAEAIDNAVKFKTDQAKSILMKISAGLNRTLAGMKPG